MAAYPGCDLALYDPARPWNKGPTPEHNPWTLGKPPSEGHTRPTGMAISSEGLIYVGNDAGYGVSGGAVAVLDPSAGRIMSSLREPFVRRSVESLAAHPHEPILYVGCKGEGRVIAWDIRKGRALWEVVPVPDASRVSSLQYFEGRLCGTAARDYPTQHFFVLDPATGATRSAARTPAGSVVHGNVRLGPDGWLYGLSYVRPTLFRIQPRTGLVQEIARPSQAHGYAFAVTSDGLYFSHGATLARYRFDSPLVP